MALLTQSTYSIKRIPKENYRFDISPETISLPSKADGSDTDYSTAKANLKLSYDGKEIYPNYDERLEDEIGGRNLILNSLNRISLNSNDGRIYPTQDELVSGENYRRFRRTYPEGITSTEISTYTSEFFTPEKSGYYTHSFYFRPNEFDIELRVSSGAPTLCKANEWTQVSRTVYFEAGVANRLGGAWGEMPPEAVQWIDYNRVSVTSGNKATDWTPAPEDLDAQINAALIKQNCEATVENGVLSVTGLTANAGYVDIPIDYGVFKQTKRLTLAKSKQGNDGKSITLVDVEYAVNTSPTTPPIESSSLWKTDADPISGNQQLWTRTKTTYSRGDPTYTTPANITPKTGATGQGVESITEQFYLSNSKTTQTGSSWKDKPDEWVNGKFMWTRSKIVYKNPTDTKYTEPLVSSEWEAINNIEIGGSNLLSGTKDMSVNTSPNSGIAYDLFNGFTVSEIFGLGGQTNREAFKCQSPLLEGLGTVFTASFYARSGSYIGSNFYCYFYSPSNTISSINSQGATSSATDGASVFNFTTEWERYWVTWIIPPTTSSKILVIGRVLTLGANIQIAGVKLEKGNKPTDWSESAEDVEANIETAKADAESAAKTYADTKSEAERVLAEAYADGIVTAEEQARIDDVNTKLAAAKAYAEAQDALLKTQQEAYADGKISTAEQAAIQAAKDYADLKKTEAEAYADGIVSDEEARAIADALAKYNEAKAHAEQLVKDIEVGGRNLLLNTKELKGFQFATTDKYLDFNICRTTKDTSNYLDTFKTTTIAPPEGNTHVVSFYAKSSVPMSMNCHWYSPNTTTSAVNSDGHKSTSADGTSTFNITTEWKRYWVVWTQTATDTVKRVIIGRNAGVEGTILEIAGVKLEKGNKATDWSPAPEDTQAAINKAQADANVSLAKTAGFTKIGGVNFPEGLIFTSLIKLLDAGNDGQEMAGVSGIAGANKKDPAFWAGGNYDQATGGTAKAIIRHDGSSKFTDAEIEGEITAKEGGNIGGFSVSGNRLVSNGGEIKFNHISTGISAYNTFGSTTESKYAYINGNPNAYTYRGYNFSVISNRKTIFASLSDWTKMVISNLYEILFKSSQAQTRYGRYGYQYAGLGSGHMILDGIIDGAAFDEVTFDGNNQIVSIRQPFHSNRITVNSGSYTSCLLVLPDISTLRAAVGVGVVSSRRDKFTFRITIINTGTKAVIIAGKNTINIGGSQVFNIEQYPLLYEYGELKTTGSDTWVFDKRSKTFILTWDGSSYYAISEQHDNG